MDDINTPQPEKTNPTSTLHKREIQAPLVVCFIEQMTEELGAERAQQIATAAIQRDAMKAGQATAEQYGDNSIHALRRAVEEIWASENALELTLLEETDRKLSFNVTRCRYAELYERLGVRQYGECLSCQRDAALIQAFNPQMRLARSQTIMQGAAYCDFRIAWKESGC